MTLFLALGVRKATSIIIKFPAIALTPAFTFWAFGPISSTSCCIYKKKEPKIKLRYRFTWINALLTSLISAGFLAYAWFKDVDIGHGILNDGFFSKGFRGPLATKRISFLTACILIPFSLLTLLLIQCIGKSPCQSIDKHLPMKPKVTYDFEKNEKC